MRSVSHEIHATRPRAFTLVELLVVIAILSILAGLLLPALSQVRKVAQRAACASGQKQIYLGAAMYAGDYADCLPNVVTATGRAHAVTTEGCHFANDYLSVPVENFVKYECYGQMKSLKNLLRCPAVDTQFTGDWGRLYGESWERMFTQYMFTAFTAWDWQNKVVYRHCRLGKMKSDVLLLQDMMYTIPTEPLNLDRYQYNNNHASVWPGFSPEGANGLFADGRVAWTQAGNTVKPSATEGALFPASYGFYYGYSASSNTVRMYNPSGAAINDPAEAAKHFW